MTALAENRYGKSRVRLARVKRTPSGIIPGMDGSNSAAGRFRELLYGRRQQRNPADGYDEKYRVLAGADFVC